jgi:hypothetical protein
MWDNVPTYAQSGTVDGLCDLPEDVFGNTDSVAA